MLPKENLFKDDTDVTFVEADQTKSELMPASLTQTDKIEEQTVEETPALIPAENANKACVLIVEDNEELLQLPTNLLSPLYRVVIAMNGKDGLQKVMDERPDLILSDVMIPAMNGMKMCTKIKNNFDLCHIPVILLTALTTNDKKMEELQYGADEYIEKPFNNKMLQIHIASILRNQKLIKQTFSQEMATSEASIEVEMQSLALNPIDTNFLKQLETTIRTHIADSEFNIQALAKEMALSRSAFYNKLKALSCMSPNEFIMNARLKYVAELLRTHPELQITEIAYQAGFRSLRYFRHCFKARFNQSPQEYRGK